MNNPTAFKATGFSTDDNNFFVCYLGEYFYMNSHGEHLPSKREKELGKKITPQEWTWAKKEWGQEMITFESTYEPKIKKALKQRKEFLETYDRPERNFYDRGQKPTFREVIKNY